MRNCSPLEEVPMISFPVSSTRSTCPVFTQRTNSLKLTGVSPGRNWDERFQTRNTTTTRTIQNNKLRVVEFTKLPPKD